jgi:rhamnosyltransferase
MNRIMTGRRSKPDCSLVIRAYNEAEHLGRLLAGIERQSKKDVEVILVDSGSIDQTEAIAKQYGAKVLHVRPEEFTFGRSLNRGIEHAQADFVVIASAHVYPVYPDWLEHLLAPFQDPKVVLTYGKQRGTDESQFSERQIFQHWYPDHSDLRQVHPFCNNANAAVRRSLWEQHPYDESLSGLEDIAWANWAIEQGSMLGYVSEAEVVHVHNEKPQAVFNRYWREAMAFKQIFPQENFNFGHFIKLVISNIANDLFQASRQGELVKSFGSIFWFRWNQFWGTYQGYRRSGPLTQQLRQTFYYPQNLRHAKLYTERDIEPIRYQDG